MLKLLERTVCKNGKWHAKYECVCGNIKEIRISAVTSGSTKSCGCHRKKQAVQNGKLATKHGKTNSREYRLWTQLKCFCNPKSNKYKNLKMCQDWYDFFVFLEWYNENYSPGKTIYWHDDYLSPETCSFILTNESKISKTRNTYLSVLGVEHYTKLESNKNKVKKINIDKYNKEHFFQTENFKTKSRKTCLDKYGVEIAAQSNIVKLKQETTNLKRYNTKSSFQNKEVYARYLENMLKKYGVTNPLYVPEFRKKFIENGKSRTSFPEKELKSWFKSLGFEFKKTRKIINGELDLYNPELKLAIEYCGLYWHTEQFIDKNKHYQKFIECEKLGIQLITIFGDEWDNRKFQIKNHLRSIIQNNRIYARNCVFQNIDKKIARNFIETNHIQGLKKSPLHSFGLLYNDELVGVISYSLHPRQSNKIVLNRLCFKSGITVVGGASKLFKNSCKYITGPIYSWSDNRYSVGKIYEKLGFKLENNLVPDYSYITPNGQCRIPKQKMKKSNIKCPDNITEKEFLKDLGYYRIWDCGKKLWVYNNRQ